MPTFEHTIEIEAPIEHVFAFGTDPANWQRVMPALTDVDVVEETDDGARMNATWRMLGQAIDGAMEIRVVEPNAHTVTTFESPGLTGELHYRYSATDSGTRVVQQADYELGDSLLDRVLQPVARRYNKRQFKNALQTTKDLIETEARTEVAGHA